MVRNWSRVIEPPWMSIACTLPAQQAGKLCVASSCEAAVERAASLILSRQGSGLVHRFPAAAMRLCETGSRGTPQK